MLLTVRVVEADINIFAACFFFLISCFVTFLAIGFARLGPCLLLLIFCFLFIFLRFRRCLWSISAFRTYVVVAFGLPFQGKGTVVLPESFFLLLRFLIGLSRAVWIRGVCIICPALNEYFHCLFFADFHWIEF